MSGLSLSQKTQVTKYSGIQVQSTSSALPIAICYGCNVNTPNLFWYNNFVAKGSGGKGGGKGGSSQPTSYTYTAAVAMGLSEGEIHGIGSVWQGTPSALTLDAVGLSLYNGTTPQTPWNYVTTNFPAQALSYPGTAYVYASTWNLGSSASINSSIFEVQGLLYTSGYNGIDADPAEVMYDFLTNSQYGVGFPAASIDSTSLFTNSGDSSYETYCKAVGVAISPILNSQEPAQSIINRWLQITNSTVIWSDGRLKFIPYGDSVLSSVISGVTYTYTPNTTPLYSLTDEDFLFEKGQDPITVERSDAYSLKNWINIEIQSRVDNYNTGPIPAFDQASINMIGRRVGPTITAHEITDPNVAAMMAQILLQRMLYVRRTFSFRLGEEFCLLEPMDLVQVTDTLIGLNATTVRITEIQEQEDGSFEIKAEEYSGNMGTGVQYPVQNKSNGVPDATVAAPAVNTPLILEPTPALTNNVSQLWLGASGVGASTVWGGCYVWVSLDGSSYENIATISSAARQGVLTSSLPAYSGANPDSTNSLYVNMSQSGGSLQTTTTASAAGGYNLAIAGGEFLTFVTATLTSANYYTLTNLYRGLDGTTPGPDTSGSQFCMLDSSVIRYDLPANMVGKTLYLKFQSFNIFGGGVQSISACTAYTYTVSGTGTVDAVVTALASGISMDWGSVTSSVTQSSNWGGTTSTVTASIDLGKCH